MENMVTMDSVEAFLDKFTSAVDFQNPVELRANTLLADLDEWDSLAALGVIVMFDMEYGVTITGSDLKDCATINDIFRLVEKKKG